MTDEGHSNNRLFHRLRVVCIPMIVGISKFFIGLSIGWPSVLPKIQNDNSSSFEVTDVDAQWLISLPGIVGLFSTLITGPLVELIGPMRLLTWIHFPVVIFFLISAFTPYISLLYMGRVGVSMVMTINAPLSPMVISELSEPKIRGALMALEEIMVSAGLLVMYVMAHELSWVTATGLCAIPSAVLFLLFQLFPESPFWLARKGHTEEAERSFIKLRFTKDQAIQELGDLTKSVKDTRQKSIKDQMRALKQSQNFLPVLLLFSIFVLRETGGEYSVFSYSVYIFEIAGVAMDPFLCTVLVGVTRTLSTIVSAVLIDIVGRRPLMILTTVICSLSACVCGVFLVIKVPGTSWVPLFGVLSYVAGYGLGLGPIPWGLTGEMIPTPVRSIGGPICIFAYALSVFIMGHVFPILISFIGLGFTFIFFAVSLAILVIIILLFFPETKGKSLNDLKDAFRKNTRVISH